MDKYYEELDALARKYRADLHSTKTDKNLSGFGKEKRAEELKAGFGESLRDLRLQFDSDVSARLNNIENVIMPPDADRLRVRSIKQKLADGERFMGQESLFYALMGSIDELREDLHRSTFVNSGSRLSNEEMARVFNDAVERQDTRRLTWLKEAAELTGKGLEGVLKERGRADRADRGREAYIGAEEAQAYGRGACEAERALRVQRREGARKRGGVCGFEGRGGESRRGGGGVRRRWGFRLRCEAVPDRVYLCNEKGKDKEYSSFPK